MADLNDNKRSRLQRHRNDKMNRLLNYLIAVVLLLIAVTSYVIFFTGDEKEVKEQDVAQQQENENDAQQAENEPAQRIEQQEDQDEKETQQEPEIEQNVTVSPSTDPVVQEEIVDSSWQPTKTAQTGEHTSVFQEGHIDYEEKLTTVYNVTNLTADNAIIWSFKNNGGADKAIAVVSSKDKEQKYRVSIEWVAQQGWKAIKLEKLNTIEGAW